MAWQKEGSIKGPAGSGGTEKLPEITTFCGRNVIQIKAKYYHSQKTVSFYCTDTENLPFGNYFNFLNTTLLPAEFVGNPLGVYVYTTSGFYSTTTTLESASDLNFLTLSLGDVTDSYRVTFGQIDFSVVITASDATRIATSMLAKGATQAQVAKHLEALGYICLFSNSGEPMASPANSDGPTT